MNPDRRRTAEQGSPGQFSNCPRTRPCRCPLVPWSQNPNLGIETREVGSSRAAFGHRKVGVVGVAAVGAAANMGGMPVLQVGAEIEHAIRYAHIAILEGTGASQYALAAVSARLAEVVLRDERALLRVGRKVVKT